MSPLPRYFAEKSLLKIKVRLSKPQQVSVDALLTLMNEEGRVNYNILRDALSPLASSINSANTMLGRFLDRINETAKEAGMVLTAVTTANKKAGDDRWVWFEGLADVTTKPYTGDLNGIPEVVRMKDQRGMPLGRPVILMTFNEHEARAVLAAFSAAGRGQETEGPYVFIRLGIHGNQEVIHVISRQGRKYAQQTASWAIERHHPSAVIGVGIAFGVRNGKRRIGDVLVSDYLFDYESARVNGDGSKTFRGARPPASRLLVDRIRAIDHLRGEHPNWPKVHVGPIACGDKLVDNMEFIKEIQTPEPEFIGGEMEGAGIELAASAAKIDWVIIKGISDWGDGNKNSSSKEDDQKTAAANSALVVKALLEHGVLSPQPDKAPLPTPAQPPQPCKECHPPSTRVMGLRDLHDLPGERVDDEAQGIPTNLDSKRSTEMTQLCAERRNNVANEGKAVLPYLRQWLGDSAAPPLFALLGEYGMGKTITCQLLAKQLDEERQQDPTRPIPLYFDLRHVTGLRERVPKLHEALEECMSRGWIDDSQGQTYSLADIHRWIEQGAVVIFDGLDEVLVKLTEADGKVFTDNLIKLIADARARARDVGRTPQPKVLITCRTQYFPNLQAQNSHFTQSDRGEFGADQYRAMVLLPWGEDQVRRYLGHALPETDLDHLLEMVCSIHNLEELTQRPYTLKLVSEFIPDIENDRAAGRTVYGVTLYRKMAEKWLTRDSGKHHIKPEHKLRLAAHLAAYLWRTGRSSLKTEELNSWFHEWMEEEADLRRRYSGLHPDQLEEDLRTATFLSRQDEGDTSSFRFAHSSLLEFFLARYLLNAVERGEASGWAIPVPSNETLDFLGQLFGEANNPRLLETLQAWRTPYTSQTSELLLAYAMRALHGDWPLPVLRGADLRGSRLRSWVLAGRDDCKLDLAGACFDGADLRGSTFRLAILEQASFAGAFLGQANFLQCSAKAATFEATELTGSIFRSCLLDEAKWHRAKGYRPQWINCTPEGAPWLADTELMLTKPLFGPTTATSNNEELAWLAGEYAYAAAFAPALDKSGRYWLATANNDGTVRMIDVVSGETGLILRGHLGWVFSCAFAPVSDNLGRFWLATAGYDRSVRLWNAATGEAGLVLHGHESTVLCCAYAPARDDQGRLWLASTDDEGTIRLWDVDSGEAGPVLHGHDGDVAACALTVAPDGSNKIWLASTGEDGTVRLWDTSTAETKYVLRGHVGKVWDCAFAPQPDNLHRLWLATAGEDGSIRLWNAQTGESGPMLTGAPEDAVISCAFTPVPDDSGRFWLASTGQSGAVRLWDPINGDTKLAKNVHEGGALCCTFAPALDSQSRRWLASIGYDGDVRLWDAHTGEAGPAVQSSRNYRVWSCAVAPALGKDGRLRLASSGTHRTVRLWDVETGKAILELKGHRSWIWFCTFAPVPDKTGRYWLASSDMDGAVRLWDATTGEVGPILQGHEDRVWACAFAPHLDASGRLWLASASEDGTIRLWDASTGESGPLLRGHEGSVNSCAFSVAADGAGEFWLATAGDDKTVRVWDIPSGRLRLQLKGHEDVIRSCAFAPVQDTLSKVWLATTGDDSTVRLWDAASGESGWVLRGHQDQVWCCAFAPVVDKANRLWLATAGGDGTLRLWNASSGEAGPVLLGHDDGIRSCAFLPTLNSDDEYQLISAGEDGTLRLWNTTQSLCLRITAQCRPSPGGDAGHAVWEPKDNRVVEIIGDAWRHLAWLRPIPASLPERLPIETFGPIVTSEQFPSN